MKSEVLECLIEYKWAVLAIIIIVGLLIFRKEFNKFLDWLRGFKRIAKTKDGYSASTAPESAGTEQVPPIADKSQLSENKQLAIEEAKSSETEDNKPDDDWLTPFVADEYPKAREILQNMIAREQDPQNLADHRAMLGVVIMEEDKQKGIEYFQDLIRAGTNDQKVYSWFGRSVSWRGDYVKATEVLQEGIKLYPSDPELADRLASVLNSQKAHLEAVRVLQKNLRQNPTYAQSYRTLAQILVDLDMRENALKCCCSGLRQCPRDTLLIEKYIEILPEDVSSKERMYAYLRLTEIDPKNPTYWTMLGNEYLVLDLNDLALEAYHKGNTLANEKEAWILENIGNIMNSRGFHSRAAEFLQRGVQLNPTSQYGHERLGQALEAASKEKNKRDEVRKEVAKAMKENSGTLDLLAEQVQSKLAQQAPPNPSS